MLFQSEKFHKVQISTVCNKVKWGLLVSIQTWGVTPLFINQILYNVKMSLACSVMKWCLLVCIQTWWVTPLFINQIHHDVQMTLLSSITKRSTAIHTRLKCLDHVRSVMKNLTVFRWPFSAAMYKGVLCCQRGHKVLQWIVFLKLEPQLKIWNNHFHN